MRALAVPILLAALSAPAVAEPSPARDMLPMDAGWTIDAAALARAIQRCWRPPGRMAGPPVEVRVRLSLAADGRVEGTPRVDHLSDDPYHQRFTASVLRAVQACAPFRAVGPARDIVVGFRSE